MFKIYMFQQFCQVIDYIFVTGKIVVSNTPSHKDVKGLIALRTFDSVNNVDHHGDFSSVRDILTVIVRP